MIRCEKCNHDTCLELSFPECLKESPDGTIYRACLHCGAEIYPRHGQWVAQYPGREVAGYWLSQLNSAYVSPSEILKLYLNPPNGNLQEVYNSKLGMAYISAENRLTPADVYFLCGSELHVVIGRKMENGRKKNPLHR